MFHAILIAIAFNSANIIGITQLDLGVNFGTKAECDIAVTQASATFTTGWNIQPPVPAVATDPLVANAGAIATTGYCQQFTPEAPLTVNVVPLNGGPVKVVKPVKVN